MRGRKRPSSTRHCFSVTQVTSCSSVSPATADPRARQGRRLAIPCAAHGLRYSSCWWYVRTGLPGMSASAMTGWQISVCNRGRKLMSEKGQCSLFETYVLSVVTEGFLRRKGRRSLSAKDDG